jgi:hypothetical protein
LRQLLDLLRVGARLRVAAARAAGRRQAERERGERKRAMPSFRP